MEGAEAENAPRTRQYWTILPTLVSQLGSAIGVADGEPYTEWILRTVAFLWVNFASGCKSVVCFKKVVA
jgi:hypothetical protein